MADEFIIYRVPLAEADKDPWPLGFSRGERLRTRQTLRTRSMYHMPWRMLPAEDCGKFQTQAAGWSWEVFMRGPWKALTEAQPSSEGEDRGVSALPGFLPH